MANPDKTQKPTWDERWQRTKEALGEFADSEFGKAALNAGQAAVPAIAGGNHLMVGDGLIGLGAIAGAVNPLLGLAVTTGGALMNAAFGSNVNHAAIKQYDDKLLEYSRPNITARDNSQLLSQINGMKDFGPIDKGSLGTEGWFNTDVSSEYSRLNRDLQAANASRARLVDDAVSRVDKLNDARIAMNYRAFGGPMFGYFSDGAIAYDMAKDSLFAKLKAAEDKKTSSAPISAFAMGGNMGSPFTNGVTMVNEGGSHESNPNMGVPMGMAEDGQPNLVEEGEVIYKDYVFSNRLKVPKAVRNKYKLRGTKDMTYAEAFTNAQKESEERENDPISKNGLDNIAMILAQSQEEQRAEQSSRQKCKGGRLFLYGSQLPQYNPQSMTPEEYARIHGVYPEGFGSSEWTAEEIARVAPHAVAPSSASGAPGTTDNSFLPWAVYTATGIYPGMNFPAVAKTTQPPISEKGGPEEDPKDKKKRGTGFNKGFSANLMRFAEPFGNMYAVWSDATGRTNTPKVYDYIPDYSPISFNPIGEYVPEMHLDTRYAANQAAQQAAATRSAILNNTAPNRWANLLAADYNAQIANGQLLRDAQIAEYDNLLKARTFNRATNQSNSEMGLRAMADDSQQRLAYANARLQQARYTEDSSNSAMGARGQNIKALTTSLANMGREQDAYNWRDMLLRAGVFGTLSEKPTSWSDKKWQAYQNALGMSACGGPLKKRKKGLTY